MKIYFIEYISHYKNCDPDSPIYMILNNLYFTSKKHADHYAKNIIKLKENDYFIEKLTLFI